MSFITHVKSDLIVRFSSDNSKIYEYISNKNEAGLTFTHKIHRRLQIKRICLQIIDNSDDSESESD